MHRASLKQGIEANTSTATLKGSTEDEQFMDGTH